jgi:hypothetical protein
MSKKRSGAAALHDISAAADASVAAAPDRRAPERETAPGGAALLESSDPPGYAAFTAVRKLSTSCFRRPD